MEERQRARRQRRPKGQEGNRLRRPEPVPVPATGLVIPRLDASLVSIPLEDTPEAVQACKLLGPYIRDDDRGEHSTDFLTRGLRRIERELPLRERHGLRVDLFTADGAKDSGAITSDDHDEQLPGMFFGIRVRDNHWLRNVSKLPLPQPLLQQFVQWLGVFPQTLAPAQYLSFVEHVCWRGESSEASLLYEDILGDRSNSDLSSLPHYDKLEKGNLTDDEWRALYAAMEKAGIESPYPRLIDVKAEWPEWAAIAKSPDDFTQFVRGLSKHDRKLGQLAAAIGPKPAIPARLDYFHAYHRLEWFYVGWSQKHDALIHALDDWDQYANQVGVTELCLMTDAPARKAVPLLKQATELYAKIYDLFTHANHLCHSR